MVAPSPRLLAGLGSLGLLGSWGPFLAVFAVPLPVGLLLLGTPLAALALLAGLLHPGRGWTFALVIPASLFLGLLHFG